jgi:hypothetical protein
MTARDLDRAGRSSSIIPIAAFASGVALTVAVALAASGVMGAVPPATPVSPPAATPVPTDGGHDAMPIKVNLENVTGADVHVDIADQTGLLVKAVSGKPAEGQSVAPYTLQVENLDPTTLKLSWVDYPIDNALALYIEEFEGSIRFLLIQPEPTGPTDSIGMDRELILSFSQPISADHVEAFLQDGLDTPADPGASPR